MTKETAIKLFQDQRVRVHWYSYKEKWYFSIIDVIEVLTESPRPRKYWNALKTKLNNEGSEMSHNLGQLKMKAIDGKMRMTDIADTKQLLRLIQYIPSPKAETFSESKKIAKQGGTIAGNTRKEIEEKTGKKVISPLNAKELSEKEEDENKELNE